MEIDIERLLEILRIALDEDRKEASVRMYQTPTEPTDD